MKASALIWTTRGARETSLLNFRAEGSSRDRFRARNTLRGSALGVGLCLRSSWARGLAAAQCAEYELHGVEACQIPAVATERSLDEMEAVQNTVERALEVAVLMLAHRRQGQRVAVRYLVALEHLVRVRVRVRSGFGSG